jgi:uncharacterized protein (DUF1786 family)
VGAGCRVYATADVAHTFGDADTVREMGIVIVPARERPPETVRLELRDLDLAAIQHTFMAVGVPVHPDAIAVAVFDHGAPRPGESDRASRFGYLTRRLQVEADLAALAYMRADIPPDLSRMRAVAASTPPTVPLMVMDTAFAALLGSYHDPIVHRQDPVVLIHLGTMHTLAVQLRGGRVSGLFEVHTDQLSTSKLDSWLAALVEGTLDPDAVSRDGGHGAWLLNPAPAPLTFLAASGPRCDLICGSRYQPTLSMPHGAAGAPGCWGLLYAYARSHPEVASLLLLP